MYISISKLKYIYICVNDSCNTNTLISYMNVAFSAVFLQTLYIKTEFGGLFRLFTRDMARGRPLFRDV